MKNLCVLINVIGILQVVPVLAGDSPSSPIIKQFEVDEYNKVIRPYDRVDDKRSEIIVKEVGHLRLECHANYPVQWIYTGSGIPIINTDLSFSKTLSTTERRNDHLNNQYVASVFLGPLREYHTGKYQCSRTDSLTVIPNLYVYVPGQELFVSIEGKTILINQNASMPSIPCSVSHPRAQVALYKLDGERLSKPVTTSDDAIFYDPRKGFRINLRKVEDPEGRYLCTARYNDQIRDVEHTVTSNSKPIAPANYEDLKCRDPCEYSIRCGTGSMCRVIDNRPLCLCPPGLVGDPTKECLKIEREPFEREQYS